nr:hypothetical protein [uncultured Actinomyces sp.]
MRNREALLKRGVGLSEILPVAQFGEWHSRAVPVRPQEAWRRLLALRWADLRLTRPFLLARGFAVARLLDQRWHEVFRRTAVFEEHEPCSLRFVMVGRPWSAVPAVHRVSSLEEASAFTEAGWLKYGMDFHLTALPGGWTFVETSTLCEATDASARRRFRAYWTAIRPFSGLVRRDVLTVLSRSPE